MAHLAERIPELNRVQELRTATTVQIRELDETDRESELVAAIKCVIGDIDPSGIVINCLRTENASGSGRNHYKRKNDPGSSLRRKGATPCYT